MISLGSTPPNIPCQITLPLRAYLHFMSLFSSYPPLLSSFPHIACRWAVTNPQVNMPSKFVSRSFVRGEAGAILTEVIKIVKSLKEFKVYMK